MPEVRNLIIILGDQLNRTSAVFHDFDHEQDLVLMAEVKEESTHVWSSKPRIAVFLSAMRHFARELEQDGIPVHYSSLDDSRPETDLGEALESAVSQYRPQSCLFAKPGDFRVEQQLTETLSRLGTRFFILEDNSFLSTPEEFVDYASSRKQIRLEFFYRMLRKKHGVLMDENGKPVGGAWNFDKSNRNAFPKSGPGTLPAPISFKPDTITREVFETIDNYFSDHPGSLEDFDWPVTRAQALDALEDFITHRLPEFGKYQDAMWQGEPWLYHSRISAALNLKLLLPSEAISAAENALSHNQAPIEAVEGFIRQILGWREYVRGIYWWKMPDYLESNYFEASRPLPEFFWNGETEMTCLRDTINQTLKFGYAHHIQRLMVTGLFSLIAGIRPYEVHQWYLSVYVDAVDWVEVPNALGMSQFADGGIMASKPYSASGKYIQRMSNYCQNCRFKPEVSSGPEACPFTNLYWNFLHTNRSKIESIPRMDFQLKNLDRLSPAKLEEIQESATKLLNNLP